MQILIWGVLAKSLDPYSLGPHNESMGKKGLQKDRRVINLALFKKMKEFPCYVCEMPGPNDCHHLRTRGAGGGDEISNLMTLCREHHMDAHRIGVKSFAEKYRLPISFDKGYPELIISDPEKIF